MKREEVLKAKRKGKKNELKRVESSPPAFIKTKEINAERINSLRTPRFLQLLSPSSVKCSQTTSLSLHLCSLLSSLHILFIYINEMSNSYCIR